MASDHDLLVGRQRPDRYRAPRRADARATRGVRRGIEHEPEPCRLLADPRADFRGMLADAAGEHERIEPAERRRLTFVADQDWPPGDAAVIGGQLLRREDALHGSPGGRRFARRALSLDRR